MVNEPAGDIVTVPVPVGDIAVFTFAPLTVTCVNVPALAVLAPITTLSIAEAVVGLMVNAPAGDIATVPVPVGENVTFLLAAVIEIALPTVMPAAA